eukprot:PhF_6_TR30189/c0_g2_i1/m.44343
MWGYFTKAAQGIQNSLQEVVGYEEETAPHSTQNAHVDNTQHAADHSVSSNAGDGAAEHSSSGPMSSSSSNAHHGDNDSSHKQGHHKRQQMTKQAKAKVTAIGKSWLGAMASFVKTVQNDLGAHVGSPSGQFLRELEMSNVMDQMDNAELYAYLVDIVDRVEAFGEEISTEARQFRYELEIEEQVSLMPSLRACYDDWELGVNKSLSRAHEIV